MVPYGLVKMSSLHIANSINKKNLKIKTHIKLKQQLRRGDISTETKVKGVLIRALVVAICINRFSIVSFL